MIVLREADYVTVPWKNGGGITREILKVPPDTAAFDWRLSLATIEQPGPFSAFDGYDRTLVLVRGAGVELDFGSQGRAVLRAPGQLAAFDGACSTSCTLIDGPSRDLNLIVSKARAESRARLVRVTAPEFLHTAGWEETLICCVTGAAQIEDAARSHRHPLRRGRRALHPGRWRPHLRTGWRRARTVIRCRTAPSREQRPQTDFIT